MDLTLFLGSCASSCEGNADCTWPLGIYPCHVDNTCGTSSHHVSYACGPPPHGLYRWHICSPLPSLLLHGMPRQHTASYPPPQTAWGTHNPPVSHCLSSAGSMLSPWALPYHVAVREVAREAPQATHGLQASSCIAQI